MVDFKCSLLEERLIGDELRDWPTYLPCQFAKDNVEIYSLPIVTERSPDLLTQFSMEGHDRDVDIYLLLEILFNFSTSN